ncbi:MAG: cytochrome-c peroxidase [Granulosicoccaceae bacterium]
MTATPTSRLPMVATALLLIGLAIAYAATPTTEQTFKNPWPSTRFKLLQALALSESDPESNLNKSDNPLVTLGHTLFYDTQLNPKTELGCVSCHSPALAFSDGKQHPPNNPQKRNAPSLIGATEQTWQLWDGRKDSAWSQALAPLFAAHEINLSPEQLLATVSGSARYRPLLDTAFGYWPEQIPAANSDEGLQLQVSIGLALEAFLGELRFRVAPFDRYIWALSQGDFEEANRWLDADQQAGLQVMLRSNCLSCHRGPSFRDGQFRNIGTGGNDRGRAQGLELWRADSFNCERQVAKAIGRDCALGHTGEAEIPRLLNGAFKTPTLRELVHTAPYMHDGRYATLGEVIRHYRNPPAGDHGLADIQLSDGEAEQLEAFLRALSSPVDGQAWYNQAP